MKKRKNKAKDEGKKEKGKRDRIELNRAGNFFEHRDRSRHRHRSIRRRKNDVRFLYRNVRRASKKLFGPRKPRCVDFIRQTYSKRYDFFDRFRSFSSTAIDRGIGIGRIGVEKTPFDFCREMYGAPAKKCSGPENRDASISLGRHIANAMIFSTVFDPFRAPRSIEASASVDSASKKRRSIS